MIKTHRQGVMKMEYIYNDGGRNEAGYKGDADDCVVRSISIAINQPYQKVYDSLFELNRNNNKNPRRCSPRDGNTNMNTIKSYLKSLDWEWVPTMKIGSGCQVHMKKSELPAGRIIVRLSKHLAAVIDGVLHDTYDCTRNETRCVYGYWKKND